MSDSDRMTAEELRQFVERADLKEQESEVLAEAKGRGYDTAAALRHVLKLRMGQDTDARAEFKAVVEMFLAARGE